MTYNANLVVFPNPLTDYAILSYTLDEDSYIQVMVFDLNGRLIQTIADGERTRGPHQELWEARGVSTGVYFVSINTPEGTSTKKVVVY